LKEKLTQEEIKSYTLPDKIEWAIVVWD